MRRMTYLVLVLSAFATAGCTGLSQREQSTLTGGAIGAGGGAVLGGVSGGSPAVGAVLGGAAGAVTGYVLGDRGARRRR